MMMFAFVVLQSYLFLYGCSIPVEQTQKTSHSALYASKCGACHRLINPHEHDRQTWEHYVEKYGKRLSAEQKQLLMDYLSQTNNMNRRQDNIN
jgi:uncharacterized protein YeaO (DUF488 family)